MKKLKFAIIGNPISHSLSPIMHNYWFSKYKINAEYELLKIDDNEIKSIMDKIKNKEIPGTIVYEDDQCFAIEDINPQAPIHILIIPHKEIAKISDTSPEDKDLLGHLLYVSKKIADKYDLDDNYRLIINNGAGAGQSVFHIHVHLMGGRSLNWPPG